MRWKFLILDKSGSLYGTNDVSIAKEFLSDYTVIGCEFGQVIVAQSFLPVYIEDAATLLAKVTAAKNEGSV